MIDRGLLLKVHRWIGLAACGLVLLQALTGALLLFRGGLAELIDPAGMVRRTAAGEAPLSRIMTAVEARYPGGDIQRIVWPQDPHGVYLVHLADAAGRTRYAAVDPGDARVLRAGGIFRFPMEAVLALHFRLFSGRWGLGLMLVSGAAILGMAVSGLVYWWPRAGRWKSAFKIDLRLPGRAVLRQVHRSGGATIAALALVSATTGLLVGLEYMIEPGELTSVVPRATRVGASPDVDRALAAARAAHPGALRDVRLPSPGSVSAFFWAPRRSALAVDAVKTALPEGRALSITPAAADASLWVTVLPLHTGEAFGLPGRLLLLAGAIGLAGLSVSGPILWLKRRRA